MTEQHVGFILDDLLIQEWYEAGIAVIEYDSTQVVVSLVHSFSEGDVIALPIKSNLAVISWMENHLNAKVVTLNGTTAIFKWEENK